MNSSQKRFLGWVGSSISIAGIIFIGLRLREYAAPLELSQLGYFTWPVVATCALIYGLANGLLALAWWNLLVFFGAAVDRLWALRLYGLTQPAKYVPGNIMHLAGRQAMGMAQKVSGWSLAKSSIWELGLISAASVFFVILVLPKFLPNLSIQLATAGFVAASFIMLVALKHKFNPAIARVFGLYLAFLLVSGSVFVGLLATITDTEWITASLVPTAGGAFILAWVAGLVTPGAPAGIGVREMVLVALLGGLVPEADLLLAVLLSRVVTMGGDLLFFLFSLQLAKIAPRTTT